MYPPQWRAGIHAATDFARCEILYFHTYSIYPLERSARTAFIHWQNSQPWMGNIHRVTSGIHTRFLSDIQQWLDKANFFVRKGFLLLWSLSARACRCRMCRCLPWKNVKQTNSSHYTHSTGPAEKCSFHPNLPRGNKKCELTWLCWK